MTARIFAYVAHKGGVPDEAALELLAAAKKIDPAASRRLWLPALVLTLMRFARASRAPTARSGKSQMKLLPIPMPNWFVKPCRWFCRPAALYCCLILTLELTLGRGFRSS